MYNIESAVAFSPSGRFACRLGQCDNDNEHQNSLHFTDFEKEIYYEIPIETVKDFVIIKFYWLDDVHIAVVHHQWGCGEVNVHRHVRMLHEFDHEARQVNLLEKVEWKNKSKRNLGGTGYFHVSEGFLTLQGEEYFIYSDIVLSEGNREFSGNEHVWLRFIPRQFREECVFETDTEIIINYKEARKAVEIDETIVAHPDEYILTASKNHLYIFYSGVNILVMDIEKYLRLLEETKTLPVYEDFVLKITIPSPVLRPYEALTHNECVVLILKDKDDQYYLRICNFNEKQLTSIYKIDGRIEPIYEDDYNTYPILFVHPSGQLVQFQTKNYVVQWQTVEHKRTFRFVNRERYLVKFLDVSKTSQSGVERLKDLASEKNLLNKMRDDSKLPRCLREKRKRLEMPVEKRC